MKLQTTLSVLFLVALSWSCGKKSDGPQPTPPIGDALFGSWEVTSGNLIPDVGLEGTSLGVATHLRLSGDGSSGTGRTFNLDDSTGVRTCTDLAITRLADGAIAVDAALPSYEGGLSIFSFLVRMPGPDEMILTREDGDEITFSRIAAPPSEVECQVIEPTGTIVLTTAPSFRSNLAAEGSNIWFTTGGELVPVNVQTGDEGTPITTDAITWDSFYNPHTIQSGDFWLTRESGGNYPADRRDTAGTSIDDFNTDLDLGMPTHIDGMNWDGTNLWVVGGNGDENGQTTRILKIDSEAEPDVVLDTFEWNDRFQQATLDGGIVWGILFGVDQMLVEVDPTTGLATSTWVLPPDHDWQGLTWLGNTLYVLGQREADGAYVVAVVNSL